MKSTREFGNIIYKQCRDSNGCKARAQPQGKKIRPIKFDWSERQV